MRDWDSLAWTFRMVCMRPRNRRKLSIEVDACKGRDGALRDARGAADQEEGLVGAQLGQRAPAPLNERRADASTGHARVELRASPAHGELVQRLGALVIEQRAVGHEVVANLGNECVGHEVNKEDQPRAVKGSGDGLSQAVNASRRHMVTYHQQRSLPTVALPLPYRAGGKGKDGRGKKGKDGERCEIIGGKMGEAFQMSEGEGRLAKGTFGERCRKTRVRRGKTRSH